MTDGEGGFIGTPQFNIELDPDAIVNVNELLQDDQIKVFPNPNDGNFNILFEKSVWENLDLKIYNVHGQLILEKELVGGEFQYAVSIPNVAEGIYFLQLKTEGEFLVKKMVLK